MSYGGRLEALMTVPSSVTVSATNSGGGPTSVSITAGSYTPTAFVAHLVTRLNAVRTPANWSGSLSVGESGTGLGTLNCTGTWALTFSTAEVGTVLGFVGNIASRSSAATGTQNARGLWLPKCPMQIDGDPSAAPEMTDARSTEGPTGDVVTLINTFKYKHRGIAWSHVTQDRVRAGAETTTYASWQSWLRDTQWGFGHAWYSPGSAFQIYWSNAGTESLVGSDLNSGAGPTHGWFASPALARFDPKKVSDQWLGVWRIEVPSIVAGD
jgi:hypothetical protein